MSKKEMMAKIRRNQVKEKTRHSVGWVYDQLKELSDYMEMGQNDGLREKCYHAIKWLMAYAVQADKSWRKPWYLEGV